MNKIIKDFLEGDGAVPSQEDLARIFPGTKVTKNDSDSFNVELPDKLRSIIFDFGEKKSIEVSLCITSEVLIFEIRKEAIKSFQEFQRLKEKFMVYLLKGIQGVPELQGWGRVAWL